MSDSELPKGITDKAKAWAAFIAREVKTQTADNHDHVFLIGRTLLDKYGFNELNSDQNDVVHGVQVIYGPFNTLARAQEFVSEYKLEWPGDNDWRYISPGKPEILSSYFDPGKSEIVHNASLDFQGQLVVQEQQRKIKEMEEIQQKLKKREDAAIKGEVKMTPEELQMRISWQQKQVESTRVQLAQMERYLDKLKTVSS